MKTADIPLQPAEAVILSETVRFYLLFGSVTLVTLLACVTHLDPGIDWNLRSEVTVTTQDMIN